MPVLPGEAGRIKERAAAPWPLPQLTYKSRYAFSLTGLRWAQK
jgi:hypothetical protein